MTLEEEPLAGGSLEGAVRVGDTVRKPAGSWTPAVHELLRHLERQGLDRVPRSLGLDERGRHTLSYLPGETVGDPDMAPWPAWAWTEETLVTVASWTRRFHDAVRTFVPPPDAAWRFPPVNPDGGTVVCHNDLAPYNVVWQGGVSGIIDWDLAGPGDPRMDVAQVGIDFAPLLSAEWAEPLGAEAGQGLRRARLVLDTYGVEDRAPFADLIVERFRWKVRRIEGTARQDPRFARLLEDKRRYLTEGLAYLERIREDLVAAFA